MSDRTSSADTASSTGSRLLSRIAGLPFAGQAALLLAALPVIALMFLGSLWEGGDAALKHRLLAWVLFAALGNLVGVVLCGLAAAALLRTRPERRLMATAALDGLKLQRWCTTPIRRNVPVQRCYSLRGEDTPEPPRPLRRRGTGRFRVHPRPKARFPLG